MTTQKLTIDLENQIKKLVQENELMKQLSTRIGFYTMYFNSLSIVETKEQAFNKVNKLYFDFFGTYRYDTFEEFRRI
jgi:hypothetical protein